MGLELRLINSIRSSVAGGSNKNIFCTEYQNIYNNLTTKPLHEDAVRQNRLVQKLVTLGVYSSCELLDIFASDSSELALKNWANPGTFDPSMVNSPTFTAYEGFTGNNTGTKCIRLNFVPSVNGTKISQNNICFIVGVGNKSVSTLYDFGASDGTTFCLLNAQFTGDLTYFYLNDVSGSSLSATPNGIAHFAASRNSSTSFDRYRNKTKLTVNKTTNGFLSTELYACGRNNNGTIIASNSQIRYIIVSSYLTESQVTGTIDAIEEYLDSYGKGMIIDPYNLNVFPITNTKMGLTWSEGATGLDSYSIERSDDGISFSEIDTITGDANSYTDTTVLENTQYYYRVRALKGVIYSEYSNIDDNITYKTPFIVELTVIDDNTLVTIPNTSDWGDEGHIYTVDFDDGSPLQFVNHYYDSTRSHTYATSGAYNLKIYGTCYSFSNFNTNMSLLVTKILSWGNVGLRFVLFRENTNLTEIASDSVTKGLGGVTNWAYTFGRTKISIIPTGLFDECVNATAFYATFLGTLITEIPTGLFDYCTKTTGFHAVFMETAITSIPTGLFNSFGLVEDCSEMFAACGQITAIPTGLFDYCVNLLTVKDSFAGCVGILSIPSALFDNCPNINDFRNTFRYNYALTGNAPELWNLYPSANGLYCFQDCTLLTNYADIPADWK